MSFIDGYTLHLKIMSTHLFFNVNFYQKERLALRILENWQIIHEKEVCKSIMFILFIIISN